MKLLIKIFIMLIAYTGIFIVSQAIANDTPNKNTIKNVYIVSIKGKIDDKLSLYLQRSIDMANEDSLAHIILLDIDTFGGLVDATVKMKDKLLASRIPVIAFINKQALSAGALIALSSSKIYMTNASVIGAAAPVDGHTGEELSEKYVSAIRKIFESTARIYNRNADIAGAMVDKSISIDGIVEKNKLLTLTTEEALEHHFIDGSYDHIQNIPELTKESPINFIETELTFFDQLVHFLTQPYLSSFLFSIAMAALLLEMKSPGVGIPGLIGFIMLSIFIWANYVIGATNWQGITIIGIGLILLAIEFFIIPGFGWIGLCGIIVTFSGFVMIIIGGDVGDINNINSDKVIEILGVVGASIFFTLCLLFTLLIFTGKKVSIFQSGLFLYKKPSLSTVQDGKQKTPLLNLDTQSKGIAFSDLRPSGQAKFGEEYISVISEEGFIEKDSDIIISAIEGNIIKVKLIS